MGISDDFPINDLVKFGFLGKTSSATSKLAKLLQFFGVGNIDALDDWLDTQKSYYRHSKSFDSERYAIAAWLRCGDIRAESIETKPYDQEKFKEHLIKIRSLTNESIETALPKTVRLCADAGVALTLVPELDGTSISGAARWLSKDKALIQLSARHKSDDHLWFTFYHEAGHILLHGKKELFIDEENQNKNSEENEADTFAQNTLISKDDWKNFIYKWADFPENIIREFANEQGIAPGIIVGRLQFQERLLSPKKQNALKRRYEWDSSWTTIKSKEAT